MLVSLSVSKVPSIILSYRTRMCQFPLQSKSSGEQGSTSADGELANTTARIAGGGS